MTAAAMLRRSLSVPFSPTQLPSLHTWLRADTLGLGDGVAVASWTDATGNGHHAAQATAGLRPVAKTAIMNGRDVVRFDGANDYLATASFTALTQPTSIVVALRVAALGVGLEGGVYVDGIAGGNRHFIFHDLADSGGKWGYYAGGGIVQGTTATTGSFVITTVFNGASSLMRINGTSVATGDPGSHTLTGLTLGTEVSGIDTKWSFEGDMAEVLVYNLALSAAQQTQLERYLGAKWGITVA